MAEPLRLVYVIGTYPSLTTTFIDREIRALRKWGVDLQVLATRRPDGNMPLSADQRALQEGVVYLLPAAWPEFVKSQLYFSFRVPQTSVYFSAHGLDSQYRGSGSAWPDAADHTGGGTKPFRFATGVCLL